MAKAKKAADAAPVAEAAAPQTAATERPEFALKATAAVNGGFIPNTASTSPTPPRKRAQPFGQAQHEHMATGILGLLDDLNDLAERVEGAYGTSTQPPRTARTLVRVCEELRAALSSRYFTDVRPRNGMTPYYPPEPDPEPAEVVEEHQDPHDDTPAFNPEV